MSKLILIVEDDAGILSLLQDALTFEGYRVHGLSSWKQDADLALIKVIQPDLVITDWLVGGQKEGLSIIKQLRSDEVTAKLPILLCTAFSNVITEIERAFGTKESDNKIKVIYKPFELDEFLQVVEQLINNARVSECF